MPPRTYTVVAKWRVPFDRSSVEHVVTLTSNRATVVLGTAAQRSASPQP